jgi:hypothetical protein
MTKKELDNDGDLILGNQDNYLQSEEFTLIKSLSKL